MLFNPSILIFIITLLSGTMISISSTSWLGMWIGLEMNLLSFIPLINSNKMPYETEASMKYFLVQAMASIIFLMGIMLSEMNNFLIDNQSSYFISTALLMKMGAAPFHFWFPGVMSGINWVNCFLLMTWQKLAPFILISYKIMNNLTLMVILFSTLVGSIGGLNQNSMRKIMAYSSISHLGWMLSAMMISNNMWLMYFIVYFLLNMAMIYLFYTQNIYFLSQYFYIKNNPLVKFSMMISMLSLAGLPPFLGFMPKWLVIQNMFNNSLFIMSLFMIMTTLFTLYFYMRLMFSSFMFINQEMKWPLNNLTDSMMTFSLMLSIMGIPLLMWMMLY